MICTICEKGLMDVIVDLFLDMSNLKYTMSIESNLLGLERRTL